MTLASEREKEEARYFVLLERMLASDSDIDFKRFARKELKGIKSAKDRSHALRRAFNEHVDLMRFAAKILEGDAFGSVQKTMNSAAPECVKKAEEVRAAWSKAKAAKP